jgi:uncharacterized protein YjiS (DUF1127 family)
MVASNVCIRNQARRSTMNRIIAAISDLPDTSGASLVSVFNNKVRRMGPARLFDVWRARSHYRAELRRLMAVAPHMIADIGLTVEEAREEMARAFWRP